MPSIIQLSSFVILLISTLIHNEIIIINYQVLKAKTQYYLDKDAYNEEMYSYYSNTMFSNSKDNDSSSESDFFDNLTCKDFNFKNLWKIFYI